MTNEDAIKILEEMKADMVPLGPLLEGKSNDEEAVDIAIEALEKQIPKKPIKSVEPFNENLYKQYCPTCGRYIAYGNSRTGMKHLLTMSQNMCGYCGQNILWRDEDDE